MKKLGFMLPDGGEMNPVVLDCCLGIDGAGPPGLFGPTDNDEIDRKHSTTILKSITRHKKVGNYGSSVFSKNGWAMTKHGFPLPKKICYLPTGKGSMVNSFGLSNDGFDAFMESGYFYEDEIIPSIFLEFGKGTIEDLKRVKSDAIYMANILKKRQALFPVDIDAVILNISCPNDGNGVCLFAAEIVKVIKIFKDEIGDIPVGIKYSYMQDISLPVAIDEAVDIAFHQAINTIPFNVVYGEEKISPLSHIGGGGVSGPAITQMALDYGKRLREALPNAKLILGGGITTLEDAIQRAKYADAIALGILVNKNTAEANKIIEYFSKGGK